MADSGSRENSDAKRFAIFSDLRAAWDGKKLKHGIKGVIAKKHKVSRWTVQKYWKLGNDVSDPVEAWENLKSKKKGRVGRKKLGDEEVISALTSLSIRERRTYRHAAVGTGFSAMGLWNAVQRGDIKRRSSGLKPSLTEKNKMERLKFCLRFIDPKTRNFDTMHHRIHVDEKWFYLKEGKLNAILAPEEDMPFRNVQSKRFITKIMFLCAVARPRFDSDGQVMFDGKIGFWAFTEEVPAQRSSKNRPRGTLELKPVNVNKDVYRKMLVENLFPAVKRKWPDRRSKIYVQQDGAPAHVREGDLEVLYQGNRYGWDINLDIQPPNSPDFNILDLGLFRSLQSTTWDSNITDIRDIVNTAEKAFKELDPLTLNDTFLSLQNHMESSMLVGGGNNFKEPHLNKERRRRAGENIELFMCSEEAYNIANAKVKQYQQMGQVKKYKNLV